MAATGNPAFARETDRRPSKAVTWQSGQEDDKPILSLDKIPTEEFIEKFLDEDGGAKMKPTHLGRLRLTREEERDTIKPFKAKVTVEPLPDENDDLETVLDDKEERLPFDETGQRAYHRACHHYKALPSSSFHRKLGYATQIDMRHYGTGPRGAQALAIPMVINTKVTVLNLKGNDLNREGIRYVTRMMGENETISELDLSDNNLQTFGARLVARMIADSSALRKLNLSGNNLSDTDARILSKPFEEHTDLKVLNLSENRFGDNSGPHFRHLISECQSLQELDLSWNCIRMKGGVEIAQGLKENVGLKLLDLSWNGFGDSGAEELGEALKTSTLQTLDLTCNRVGAEGFLALLKSLEENTELKVLKLGRNPIPEEAAMAGLDLLMTFEEICLQTLSLAEILYSKNFRQKLEELGEKHPGLEFEYGYTDSYGKRKLKQYNVVEEALGAMLKYCDEMNIKLVDLFARFDDDGSMSVTHEEFKEGLRDTKIPLTPLQVEELINALDEDGDGEIDFGELVLGAEKIENKIH